MIRVLLAAFALFVSSLSAHALVPKVSYWETKGGLAGYTTGEWSATGANWVASCDAWLAAWPNPSYSVTKKNAYTNQCVYIVTNKSTGAVVFDNVSVPTQELANVCPANSTAVTGGCQCKAGFDESGGQCVPHTNQCTAKTGQVGILSWTEGYTRTPDEGDRQAVGPIMTPPVSGEVCDGGCAVSLQTSGPGVQPYVSQYPTANGLYRRSVDYPSLGLGRECTMGTADMGAKKDAPPPDCPGSVGDLGNGKPVCVGTAAKPIVPTPLGAAPGATPIAGNPPAGGKPPTGEGSGTGSAGRTPTTGNGTASGGPAAAGIGGKGGGAGGTAAGVGVGGSGTGDEPHKPCGGPGEPTCNVKVEEKGTPEGVGTTYDAAKAKMDETKGKNDEQLQKAAGTADKGFLEPARSLFWAPPIAACEPVALPTQMQGLTVDACGVVDGGRSIMGFLWAAGGLFLCLGMIKRSI